MQGSKHWQPDQELCVCVCVCVRCVCVVCGVYVPMCSLVVVVMKDV